MKIEISENTSAVIIICLTILLICFINGIVDLKQNKYNMEAVEELAANVSVLADDVAEIQNVLIKAKLMEKKIENSDFSNLDNILNSQELSKIEKIKMKLKGLAR